MNPRTHADIMTLARDETTGHPFAYARILGICHAEVIHNVPGASKVPVNIQFLWVRWFRYDTCWKSGFKHKRLHRLEFLPASDPGTFGFLDPDEVIRGSHIIPAFAHKRTSELLGESIARNADESSDWRYYYVAMFVVFLCHIQLRALPIRKNLQR
jgi:hypothetical protein